jgi:5'-nucleotidase
VRILITNDDGIHASGLYAIAVHLAKIAEVMVVAPERQQSATSHSITLHKPLHVNSVQWGDSITAYQVNGTPADCVKIALGVLCEHAPDIVISGINSGANLGSDIIYSGTAAAAAEAALQGKPAIACSLVKPPFEFTAAVQVITTIVKTALQQGIPEHTYLNVNIPPGSLDQIKGIKVTQNGVRTYHNIYEKRLDPLGRAYYWQAGELVESENAPDTDIVAVNNGFASITPVQFHFTNPSHLATLKTWNFEK